MSCIDDWGFRSQIRAISFDSTASNIGHRAGARRFIEKDPKQNLLQLAHRHHSIEIVPEKAFIVIQISLSTGLDIVILCRFQAEWPGIDPNNFETAVDQVDVASFKDSTIAFAEEQLLEHHPRDDYKELLKLVTIFLDGTPSRGVYFLPPGALHRARWIARIIYSFQFQFLLFISEVYVNAWYQARPAVSAAVNDLCTNPDIRQEASTASNRNLWYLNEVLIGLAFFGPKIDTLEKEIIAKNI